METATLVSYVLVPMRQREKNTFIERKRKLGRAIVNRVHGFSSTESLPGKESFYLLGSAIFTGHESSLFWSPNYLFN